ncbi:MULTISPECIES: TetR/AcrR family transcriptional regulator [unclassified Pseudoalteromonas]|uniref:TetR/AcrR family transcriptional regulator n=1 Tax=unclassified Pseudoalteromonas TaxID=194690 RepID=UPI002096BB15|nr:TetR/AcrR family transcriptional regulator [Pseudoalteromonas sp. XMcav2-N]MCO7187952.1 TetR/AcrR family transcriptional regulator [Pseudoalteromonas sp. XMcav2-N]
MSDAKQSWLAFALKTLIRSGPDALTIDRLCSRKKVTKGSFYHHFKNRQAFIDALMTYWYEQATARLIAIADTQPCPKTRLERLDEAIAVTDIEAEMHIRAWALKDTSIQHHLCTIDAQRQHYLKTCYLELGLDSTQAEQLATTSYASFLGLQQLYPRLSVQECLTLSSRQAKTQLEALL